jgi:nitroreductase
MITAYRNAAAPMTVTLRMYSTGQAAALHPLLAARFSPSRFDATRAVDDTVVSVLVEAARWAPSAGNSQPWGLFVTRRGEQAHQRLVTHLAPSSRRWAPDAALLVVTASRRYVDDTQMPYSDFSDYDLGQAVAHLTIQAEALGLSSHQFRAFNLDGVSSELRVRPGWEIVSMIAVGYAVQQEPSRERRTAADICAAPWGSAGTPG